MVFDKLLSTSVYLDYIYEIIKFFFHNNSCTYARMKHFRHKGTDIFRTFLQTRILIIQSETDATNGFLKITRTTSYKQKNMDNALGKKIAHKMHGGTFL